MPNIRQVTFKIPKDSKLRKYSDQIMDILENKGTQDLINFRDQLFHDTFAFVKSELRTNTYPLIIVDFVPNQVEYESLEKETNQLIYQREKPTTQTLGFAITSETRNEIYINLEPFLELLKINCGVFILNFVNTLMHEILHCFFRNSKNEQEIHDLQYSILGKFLGVDLPNEMKKSKTSDYYKTTNKEQG